MPLLWHPRAPLMRALGFVLTVAAVGLFVVAVAPRSRAALGAAYAIARMPLIWRRGEAGFLLGADDSGFDVSFAAYNASQDSFAPAAPDLVPAVLHHIALGRRPPAPDWLDARAACLEAHPGWEAFLWTDDNAPAFVRTHFPDMWDTWRTYPYPIQRIDALRYLVLFHYGGVILDMDLKCTRSLGPLRRFGFVAPAAHPTGFSIGFMMASARHPFVGQLVANLPVFDRWWFGLPYPTVMFSTGCHYASAIHTLQSDRADLKILAGPPSNPLLHRLNGHVVTPLFHHLGTSSWHSFDAALIVYLGRFTQLRVLLVVALFVAFTVLVLQRRRARRRPGTYPATLHRDSSFYYRILEGYGRTRRKSPDLLGTDRIA